MSTCFDVADFFIANADPDGGITNLKLQKMCAYAQAFSLSLLGKRIFGSDLQAWPHGPVVKSIYNQYRAFGKETLSTDVSTHESRLPFDEEQLFILETVNNYYGRYSAWTLRDMSHHDFPGDFNNPDRPIIPDSAITTSFNANKIVKNIQAAYL